MNTFELEMLVVAFVATVFLIAFYKRRLIISVTKEDNLLNFKLELK